MNRRKILVFSAAAAGLTGAWRLGLRPRPAHAAEEIFDDDRILGDPNAPVTIIEYSSLTCPHCASFHRESLPQVKENWIETGRARLVYRHFPLDGLALRAALAADCIEGDRHFAFLDALFRGQKVWSRADDPVEALAQLSALAGLDRAQFDACLADQNHTNQVLARSQHGRNTYDIQSTPSFIVNGRKVQGALPYDDFNEVLEKAESDS